jgi:hypothetical protein
VPVDLERPLPDSELERMARHHVGYELNQMALGANRMTPEGDRYLGNAVLEAFLVHVRTLDEFLRKATPHGEDVLAIDYCSAWTPTAALEPEERLDVDRRIAHLTLRRSQGFRWKRPHLAQRVMRRFRDFLDSVQEHEPARFEWFAKDFSEARRTLRETFGGWTVGP